MPPAAPSVTEGQNTSRVQPGRLCAHTRILDPWGSELGFSGDPEHHRSSDDLTVEGRAVHTRLGALEA